jgi:hypothetical protein
LRFSLYVERRSHVTPGRHPASETVWLVRVGSESSGYERWMNQSQNGEGSGQWLDPALGSIGTTTSVVAEGKTPVLPAVPCRE